MLKSDSSISWQRKGRRTIHENVMVYDPYSSTYGFLKNEKITTDPLFRVKFKRFFGDDQMSDLDEDLNEFPQEAIPSPDVEEVRDETEERRPTCDASTQTDDQPTQTSEVHSVELSSISMDLESILAMREALKILMQEKIDNDVNLILSSV
jgi:hypothetical protein